MGSIKNFFVKSRKGLSVLIASSILSVAACDALDNLRPAEYCRRDGVNQLEEICGNVYEEGYCNPEIEEECDVNCDGDPYDGCDGDGDGYVGTDQEIVYGEGIFEAFSDTFAPCIGEEEEDCKPLLDCNDNNAEIHPGAVEQCNRIDDNCNDLNDESFPEEGDDCGLPPELDGIGVCRMGEKRCYSGQIECVGAVVEEAEKCDGLDNDCNERIDEFVPPKLFCYYKYTKGDDGNWTKVEPCGDLEGLELEEIIEVCPEIGVGTCTIGWETCTTNCDPSSETYEICEAPMMGGDKICHNVYIPQEDICDRLDNDCDGQADEDYDLDQDSFTICIEECPEPCDCDDTNPTIYPGAEEIGCNGIDEDCDGEDAVFVDLDEDGYSPSGGLCGPFDCNDENPEVHPDAFESCNCIDDNCEGLCLGDLITICTTDDDCEGVGGPCNLIDEGLHTTTPLVFMPVTDCSGSMSGEIAEVENYNSTAPMLDCFLDEYIYVTNAVGDNPPYISNALMTVADWQATYKADTPDGTCAGDEPMLNIIAYAACAVGGMESHEICQAIDSMIPFSFMDPSYPVWLPDSDNRILLFTDEAAQWQTNSYSDPEYTQEEIAQLAADAGIPVDVYCRSIHNTLNTSSNQGYGYFVELTEGDWYDLDAEVTNGTMGWKVANSFIDEYCGDD